MILALVLALAFAILAVIFALQNPMIVTVSFLTYKGEWALALLILVSVGVGILIGILVMLPGTLRRAWMVGGLRRKVSDLEKALEEQKAKSVPPSPPAAPTTNAPASPSSQQGDSDAQS
ncbi:MAG: lipopolysaccharide assembly LapA domain-containing protein [Anaerolineales bacterium]